MTNRIESNRIESNRITHIDDGEGADAREDEVLEIVSLVGTLSGGESGDCNLNIALADR